MYICGMGESIFKKQVNIWRATFQSFFKQYSFRHGAALSYYTILALIPILYLSFLTFSSIFGANYLEENVRTVFTEVVGKESIDSIFSAVDHIKLFDQEWYFQALTLLTLIFTTTAVFNSVKININHIWDLNLKHRKLFLKRIIDRLLALLSLLVLGIIILTLFIAETFIFSLSNILFEHGWGALNIFFIIAQHGIAIALNSIVFFLTFKYLPDGKTSNKYLIISSLYTATFFYVGQFFLSWYLGSVSFLRELGAAGAILLILVWIYYSSHILFIGATYINSYANYDDNPIKERDNRFLKRK